MSNRTCSLSRCDNWDTFCVLFTPKRKALFFSERGKCSQGQVPKRPIFLFESFLSKVFWSKILFSKNCRISEMITRMNFVSTRRVWRLTCEIPIFKNVELRSNSSIRSYRTSGTSVQLYFQWITSRKLTWLWVWNLNSQAASCAGWVNWVNFCACIFDPFLFLLEDTFYENVQ